MADDPSSFEIGQMLGRSAEGLENLTALFKQHCEDDDRRHVENTNILKEIKDALAPLSASHAMSKKRMALLASGGLILLGILSWVLESAVQWIVNTLLKFKFGG